MCISSFQYCSLPDVRATYNYNLHWLQKLNRRYQMFEGCKDTSTESVVNDYFEAIEGQQREGEWVLISDVVSFGRSNCNYGLEEAIDSHSDSNASELKVLLFNVVKLG